MVGGRSDWVELVCEIQWTDRLVQILVAVTA